MAEYELWMARDDGTRLALIDTFAKLDYVLLAHDIGACSLVLPGDFDTALIAPDRRLVVSRAPHGGKLQLEDAYFLRRWADATDDNGVRTITATGYNGLYLAAGRIVAAAAGSAAAEKTDYIDDMMKDIITEQLGASAAAARQISSSYLSVQGDLSAGPSVTKGFAWQNVLKVLQDLADVAWQAGTQVYFGMVPVSSTAWEFRTRTGQLGQDHTYPNGVNPVLLGLEYGNLRAPRVEWDYTDERTYVYAGGQGQGTAREIVEVEDTVRSGRSLFGRREAFADARNDASTNAATAAGNAALANARPKLRFSASIIENANTRYGIEWGWGDKLSAVYQGQQYDAMVRMVHVSVDQNGKETIEAKLEVSA